MKAYEIIPYREKDHGTFDEEWPPHKKTSGWWYITGYLADKQNPEDLLYSYQYTVAQGQISGATIYILHIALTDLQNKEHLFKQKVRLRKGKKIRANYNEVVYEPYAILTKEQEQFKLEVTTEEFDLDLSLQKGKGAFWHCDDGVLAMGLPNDPQQRDLDKRQGKDSERLFLQLSVVFGTSSALLQQRKN